MAEPRRLSDFGSLTGAEGKILAGLDDPDTTILGDGSLPPADAGPDRRVRPSFLRWCALGAGDDRRLHEHGLRVAGALIADEGGGARALDLEGCRLPADLVLFFCRFAAPPVLRSAVARSIFLDGSMLPGLDADRLTTTGDVSLDGATVEGEARLLGAKIGGDLDCDGGRFANAGGKALSAHGVRTEGHIYLHGAKVEGDAGLIGAKIGGNLECVGGQFANAGGDALSADRLTTTGDVFLGDATVEGAAGLNGAKIGGHLICDGAQFVNPDGYALSAETAEIGGAWLWRRGARAEGRVSLIGASIGVIHDDPDDWGEDMRLALDRCRFGAFTGGGVSAEARLDWLSRQINPENPQEFRPQPWEECARVLREMGHAEDARKILIDKERRLRGDRRRRLRERLAATRAKQADGPVADSAVFRTETALRFASIRDALLGATIDYGQRPLKAAAWLIGLWLLAMVIFLGAWQADGMKPNNAFILRAAEWVACGEAVGETAYLEGAKATPGLRAPGEARLACFEGTARGAAYPDFNAPVFAADVLFPLVEIEQQAHWTPDTWWGRLTMWLAIILGWALSLLAVAGFSGLVKSD